MVTEATQISRFRQNRQRVDRADPRDRAQQPVVGVIRQQLDGADLDPVALLNEAPPPASTMRNIRSASLSGPTGRPTEDVAVS